MSKTNLKRIIILSIVINMLIANSLITFASPIPTDFYKTSSYAREAVKYLFTSDTIKTQLNQAVKFDPTSYIKRVDMIKFVDYVINIGPNSMDDVGGIDREGLRWLPFTDLSDRWQSAFVGAAYRKQIVKGSRLFRPESNISREEVAAIFMRMMAYESNNEQLEQVANYDKLNVLNDKNNISSWAKGAVEIMLETGIMNGVGNQSFNPRGNATKEQIAVMLYRYIQNRQEILDKYNKMVYEAPENNNGYITMGMPAEQVHQILGEGNYKTYPDNGFAKRYVSKADGSSIYLQNQYGSYKVIGWENNGFLNVKTGRRNPLSEPFTVSSTKEDVAKAMGTPQSLERTLISNGFSSVGNEIWTYNLLGKSRCEVVFKDGKVVGWENNDKGDLKVTLGNKDTASEGFAIGDTFDDVIKAMGTPSYYFNYGGNYHEIINIGLYEPYIKIEYGYSTIKFDKNLKVLFWYNHGNLKLKQKITESQSTSLTYGSTLGDVYNVMGAPNRFETNDFNGIVQLFYDRGSNVRLGSFDFNAKIFAWVNNGNLKISMGEKDLNAPAIKVGSSFEDVIKAQGTPTIFNSFNYILYDASELHFKDNKLVKAKNVNSVLKLSEYWKNPSHETFSIGASIDEVTKSLGNPNEISLLKENYKIYEYGNAELYFDSNNILRAYLTANNIPELNLGTVKEGSASVSIGMSKQGVIDAMGTPHSIFLRDFVNSSLFISSPYNEFWSYEGKIVFINDEGKVAEIK